MVDLEWMDMLAYLNETKIQCQSWFEIISKAKNENTFVTRIFDASACIRYSWANWLATLHSRIAGRIVL